MVSTDTLIAGLVVGAGVLFVSRSADGTDTGMSNARAGTDTDTADVPGYVQNFAPAVRQQIQSLSNEQIAALPDSADSEPLSTAELDKRLGRGELYPGFADKIPDSDPVKTVQGYFRNRVSQGL